MSIISDQPLPGEPLRFAHLVQINDPRNPMVEPMSRQQLWRALVLRAQAPHLFIPWLDDSDINETASGSLERQLRFGDYRVRDRVRFDEEECVEYTVLESERPACFSLTMRIEEPAPGELFVRFLYASHSADHHAGSPLGDLIKAAYRQSDEETVFRIRQIVASGALED
jgi:hypothetical protein